MRSVTLVVVCTLALSACSSSNSATPTAPSIVQVAGNWSGQTTQTSVSGGDCVSTTGAINLGPIIFEARTGASNALTTAVTQNGSALTATGVHLLFETKYTGTASTTGIDLAATIDPTALDSRYQCTNGNFRSLLLTSRTLSATVNGNSMTGTARENWDVRAVGSPTLPVLGVLSVTYSFTLNR